MLIGCFVPDFEYFARLAPGVDGGHTFSHTLQGLFVIDLTLGMAISWLFHRYASQPLWTWWPETIRQRVKLGPRTPPLKGAAQSALVLLYVLIGAATDVLWNSFTHSSFWPARHLHFLSYTIRLPIVGSVPCYDLLHNASSVFGTIVLLIWNLCQLGNAPICPRSVENSMVYQWRGLLFVSAVALTRGALCALVGLRPPNGLHLFEVFIAELDVTAITLYWIQSVIFGFHSDKAGSHSQTA